MSRPGVACDRVRPVLLHCEAWRAGSWWIAECLEIAIVAQGRSLAEVRSNLEEAIDSYLQSCSDVQAAGRQVAHVGPVPHYYWRLAWWHVRSWWSRLRRRVSDDWRSGRDENLVVWRDRPAHATN